MAAPLAEHPTGLQHGALVKDHAHFSTTLSYDEAENVDGRQVDVTIEFGKVVSLASVQATRITVTVVQDNFESTDYTVWMTGATADVLAATATAITLVLLRVLVRLCRRTLIPLLRVANTMVRLSRLPFRLLNFREQMIRRQPMLLRTEPAANKIYVSIPSGIPSLDPADPDTSAHQTMAIDLRTVAAAQDRETPAVVSIQRLRPGSQTVVAAFQEAAVTGPFTIRVVLSEAPFEPAKFAGKINVTNGIKSGFVIGTPFTRHGGTESVTHDNDGNTPMSQTNPRGDDKAASD